MLFGFIDMQYFNATSFQRFDDRKDCFKMFRDTQITNLLRTATKDFCLSNMVSLLRLLTTSISRNGFSGLEASSCHVSHGSSAAAIAYIYTHMQETLP